jgi:3-dehydroquinate synthase
MRGYGIVNPMTAVVEPVADSAGLLMQRISVPYEYPVYFTSGLLAHDNSVLCDAISRLEPQRRHRFAVVIDDGIARVQPGIELAFQAYAARYHRFLELVDRPRIVPGGERIKNDPAALLQLQRWIWQQHIDRQSCIVVVGGGAVLDMVGFAAATAHRGVRVVRVPTTVLGQGDSAVGVKTAINAFGAKNFLGSFAPPFAVINDFSFIEALPERDRISGMAEAVKVACIRDLAFLNWIEDRADALRSFDRDATRHLIRRSAELHLRHIATAGDPFEFGSARPLDFGHWAAHKLESLSNHQLHHGEAVAIGVALDTRYAVSAGMLDAAALERLCSIFERLGLRLWHPALDLRDDAGRRTVLRGIEEFREHLGGELTITLLERLGHGVEVHSMDTSVIDASIDWLRERDLAAQCTART